ncbi:MAG: DNA mismatch repair endonuclease MutL [Candidatus Omnitrophota bacterium]
MISILSDAVIGKISAGEVVERPASVVKELVENAIDAGSKSIEIELSAAGQDLIRVADDGEGMTPEDAKMACGRYATSKLRSIDDLEKISTLGFRGEALSSIAAVSQTEVTTRTAAAGSGVYVYLEGGQMLKTRPAARTPGTTVEIRNLFYNVPARRKFLKKGSTELAAIVDVVGRFIIGHPDIEFRLTQDGRRLLDGAKNADMKERIRLVLGGDISDHMVEITHSFEEYEISGYVSSPSHTRKDRRAQMFFVNKRFFRSNVINDAVYGAYRSLLERGRYPAAVLFLKVSPSAVDVNVHPTKLQVKFDDDKTVRSLVVGAIKNKFNEIRRTVPQVLPCGPEDGILAPDGMFAENDEVQSEFGYNLRKGPFQMKGIASFSRDEDRFLAEGAGLFQIGACYIVQLAPDGITITDQHAAHERVLYEFFTRATEENPPETQNLLFPARIDLSAGEAVIMEKVIGDFRNLGFHIEPFGGKTFIAQAVPAILKDRDITTVIHDILADLASRDLARMNLSEELVKMTSCRAAIKSGDAMEKEEMISLLDQLSRCSLPFTCPHGRPTTTTITIEELEKRFHRK